MQEEEIHNLLGRYFSGEATKAEQESVHQWIKASERNEAEFKLLEELWNRSEEYPTTSFDRGTAWQRVDKALQAPAKAKTISLFAKRMVIGIAASLLLVLGVWWMIGNKKNDQTFTAEAAIKEVDLADGSKVYLRKGATLELAKGFSKDNRNVSLSGEAFFEVAHDATKPFTITAADARVRVVGTSFNLNTNDHQVKLFVKTGQVNFASLADTSNSVMVHSGEKAIFDNGQLIKELNRDINFNAWQSGKLEFENVPLGKIAAALSDYYQVTISLKKEDTLQLTDVGVTVSFDHQSLQSALNDLSLITTYHIQKINDTNYEISIK